MHHGLQTPKEIAARRHRGAAQRPLLCGTLLFFIFIPILISMPARPAHAEAVEKWAESTYTATAVVIPSCWADSSGTLTFPDIDPSTGDVHVEKRVAGFRCPLGSSWNLTMDNGLHEDGGRKRMKHESRESHIPYNLRFGADSGTGGGFQNYGDVVVKGDVFSIDLSDAAPGNYSDTVIITLTPSAW